MTAILKDRVSVGEYIVLQSWCQRRRIRYDITLSFMSLLEMIKMQVDAKQKRKTTGSKLYKEEVQTDVQ